MIPLDTHALIWLDAGNARLGEMARQQIDTALQAGMLAVSAISFWEVAMLIAEGRLDLAIDSTRWRADLLTAGLREIAVDGSIGIHAAQLANFHGDLVRSSDRRHRASCRRNAHNRRPQDPVMG